MEKLMFLDGLPEVHRGSTALELAEAFLFEMGVGDPDEAKETRETILLAAEHLVETAGPGHWGEFDVADFFDCVSFLPPRKREGIGLMLVGFFGWMFLRGFIGADQCERISSGLRDQNPSSSIIGDLVLQTESLIEVVRGEMN